MSSIFCRLKIWLCFGFRLNIYASQLLKIGAHVLRMSSVIVRVQYCPYTAQCTTITLTFEPFHAVVECSYCTWRKGRDQSIRSDLMLVVDV